MVLLIFHMAHLGGLLQWVVLAASALGALFAIHKMVVQPLNRTYKRWNSGMDTLIGYPPVIDPGSGKELKAATPPLANRVERLEELVISQADINARLHNVEQWQTMHDLWAQSEQHAMNKRIDDLLMLNKISEQDT